MGDQELVEDLFVLLDVVAILSRARATMLDNLTAVQARCDELIEENRRLKEKLESCLS